jgi:hypothetical protein
MEFLVIRVQEIWPIVCFPRWLPHRKCGSEKKCGFQYTTLNCTYSIKLVIVALCFVTDGLMDPRTDRRMDGKSENM